ncbi:MAG: DUF4474 domain-containing protein [Oscillospiraceae bacterium]|jgi:hypothetical protein|nr:DUF4474 domain-containing protein [Oscillospiraceae bacterium]
MRLIAGFGYGYDAAQNVFYTRVDAWQRRYGYCSLYDEGTALSGMIIDCEPVYFIYNDRVYLVELWKGQYDLTTGCEVGIYRDSGYNLLGTRWFESVPDGELLDMAASLYRNGELLFTRRGRHWWLTGFKLAEFSEPRDLELVTTLRFPDPAMCRAFTDAAREAGYTEEEAYAYGDTSVVYFTKPKLRQPVTRTKLISTPTQLKNKLMCEAFNAFAGGENRSVYEILADAKENYPEVYDEAIKLGRSMEKYTSRLGDLPGVEGLLTPA